MYVLIAPIKNIKFNKKRYGFYRTIDGSNAKTGLVGSHGFLNDVNPVWDILKDSNWWIDYIGLLSMQQLDESPYIYDIIDEDYIEDHADVRLVEEKNYEIMARIQLFARSFALGCWLVKDSCASCQFQYLFDIKRHFVSRIYTNHFPSMSDGMMNVEFFSRSDIEKSISWMFYIIGHETWKNQLYETNPVSMSFEGHSYAFERCISERGSSLYKAILRLEKAQMSGVISEKIDKYCSLLECIYAINKDHRKSIIDISSAFAKRKGYKRSDLEDTIRHAYSIRSDFSHGDTIKFLNDHSLHDMICVSRKMDDYLRFLMTNIIRQPLYDYSDNPLEKSKVREHFRSFIESV